MACLACPGVEESGEVGSGFESSLRAAFYAGTGFVLSLRSERSLVETIGFEPTTPTMPL